MGVKKNMQINSKKYLVLMILLVVGLICLVVGGTYAVFSWSATSASRSSNQISTGGITCTFNEGTPISITSAQPISDVIGKNLTSGTIAGYTTGYFDSTLDCSCIGDCSGTYEIYMENTTTTNAINTQYVKTYLTDGAIANELELNPVKTFASLKMAEADSSAKRIYTDTFTESFSKKFRLRVWVAEDYPVTDTSVNFSAKLYAKVSA